jgi:adenosine/AMP kinase
MTYRGRVKNGVIVLEPSANLPEGAEVEVSSAQPQQVIPTLSERLKDVIGIADGLPSDSSVNHDHYLYGAPKK